MKTTKCYYVPTKRKYRICLPLALNCPATFACTTSPVHYELLEQALATIVWDRPHTKNLGQLMTKKKCTQLSVKKTYKETEVFSAFLKFLLSYFFLGQGVRIDSLASRTARKTPCASETGRVPKQLGFCVGFFPSPIFNYLFCPHQITPNNRYRSYVDGETVKVTFQGNSVWAWKEPNNRKGKENCIIVRGSGLYEAKWNDAKCSMNARTVCKRVKQANPYVGDGWHNRADDGGSKMCYYKYFNRVLYKKEAPYRRRSWFDAEGFCNGQVNGGGHLVSINSASEQTWVQNLIYTTYNDFENRPVWIGGRRSANSWEEWTDGKQMTFTNWMPGEPSTDVNSRDGDEEERCMQMSHSHIAGGYKKTGGDNPGEDIKNTVGKKGQWNDAACSKTRGFLCEICTDEF